MERTVLLKYLFKNLTTAENNVIIKIVMYSSAGC